MKTKIKAITAVNSHGTNRYTVGQVVNGMTIEEIIDNSREYPNSIEFIYEGITTVGKSKETVFGMINLPVDIEYEQKP